ncbi:hypothetical protein E4U11_008425 [Claviceps purpurea]|nr:hypothetical protein E4U11_008425 [Claviceps purpurea]
MEQSQREQCVASTSVRGDTKPEAFNPHLPHYQRLSPPFGYKHSVIIQQQVKEDKSETPKHRNCYSRRTKRAMGDERAEQLKKMEKELREVRDPIRSSAETLKRKNELKRQLQESKGGSSKEL